GTEINDKIELAKSNRDTALRLKDTAIKEFDGEILDKAVGFLREVPDLIEEAKKLEKTAKQSAQTDLKAMKEWRELLPKTEAVRDEIKALLPGAKQQFDEIKQLLATAQGKIRDQGPIQVGFQEAVDCINKGDVPGLLKRAEKASIDLELYGYPDGVAGLMKDIVKELKELKDVAVSGIDAIYREDAN